MEVAGPGQSPWWKEDLQGLGNAAVRQLGQGQELFASDQMRLKLYQSFVSLYHKTIPLLFWVENSTSSFNL